MEKYIVAMDQGTTSSRAIVFDDKANIVAKAQQEFEQIYPVPGWVEHRPEDIWNTQFDSLEHAIQRAGIDKSQIIGIGITNQRETTIVWDKNTGKPIYNAIVWQCRRTADTCEELKSKGLEERIYQKTGLPIDAYFSASKIKWILDNVTGAREKAKNGELLFGTVDTYLMWKISGGSVHATDYTNASRTLLFNIHTLKWDEELLKLFDIPKSMLPKVTHSSGIFGYTDEKVFGVRVPISGVAGDQESALFGHLCVNKGEGKNTYGTGCFTLVNTGNQAVNSCRGLITTLTASEENGRPQYCLEGSVFVGGAVLQWLRDEMRIISQAKEADEIAEKYPSTNGVYIVPAFVGLGAPHWDAKARGIITGITRGTKREHVVRAALESIAYQVFDVVHAMESDLGHKISSLNVDGGACVSNVLMQFQADMLGAKVVRPKVVETTALGACYLAGLGVGLWKSVEDIKTNKEIDREFLPTMDKQERDKLIMGWLESVARAKYE